MEEKKVETNSENYNISFFKPTTELARLSRNLAIVLIIIWTVAIYGFHIILKLIEKPTPETAYTEYAGVWEDVKTGNPKPENNLTFIKSSLSVLGKVTVATEDKNLLDSAVTWAVYKNSTSEEVAFFKEKITQLKSSEMFSEEYFKIKQEIAQKAANVLNFEIYSNEISLLPLVMLPVEITNLSSTNLEEIPEVMSKYLIHNQSFLTDMKFLGFPFHYFYTAVFLLILFVGLCWIYCVRIEKIHKKLGIESN